MVKARAIVPLTHPETGEPIAAGAEVELGDDHYRDLRARGAVEASEEDQKASQTEDAQGNYSGRTGRADAGGEQEHPHGGPPGQTGEHPQGGPPGRQPQPEPRSEKKK